MTLQNRVTPFGDIVADPAHGTLMGNRGCLHDKHRNIVRSSARDAWVTCRLDWNGIKRRIMAPGKYTELFFLDEVTALAAGHRPCNDCRSEQLRQFQTAWAKAIEGREDARTLVSQIDPVMKRDRGGGRAPKRTYNATLGGLPDGTMVTEPSGSIVWLKWRGKLLKWTPTGYEEARAVDDSLQVAVLTPECTVKVLAVGYPAKVHESASRWE